MRLPEPQQVFVLMDKKRVKTKETGIRDLKKPKKAEFPKMDIYEHRAFWYSIREGHAP